MVLQSIDGEALPVVVIRLGAPIEVTAGNVILKQDRTCSESRTFRRTEDGIVTTETSTDACTYFMLDSESFWLYRGARRDYGEISGSTITLTDHEGDEIGAFGK